MLSCVWSLYGQSAGFPENLLKIAQLTLSHPNARFTDLGPFRVSAQNYYFCGIRRVMSLRSLGPAIARALKQGAAAEATSSKVSQVCAFTGRRCQFRMTNTARGVSGCELERHQLR